MPPRMFRAIPFPSFPCKRESSVFTLPSLELTWMPASAGMTILFFRLVTYF
jgi:hypothetical protein